MREYATAFTDEFTLGELKAALPDLEATAVVPILEATGVKSLFGGGFNYTVNSNIQNVGSEPRFRFKGPSIERLISSLADVGLSSSGAAIEAFISNRKWEKDRVHSELVVASTALGQIAVTWINGGIGTCHLTSLGVAIAHSNARRLYPDFRAPLSVWVS